MISRVLLRAGPTRSLSRASPPSATLTSPLPRLLQSFSTLRPPSFPPLVSQARLKSTSSPRSPQSHVRSGDPTPKRGGSRWHSGHNEEPSGKLNTRTKALLCVAGGGVLLYYLVHLERVPETGRWRFMDISPTYEDMLAKKTRAQFLSQFQHETLAPNHPVVRRVHRVASAILEANDLGTLEHDSAAGTGTGTSSSSSLFGGIFGGGRDREDGAQHGAGAKEGFGWGRESVGSAGDVGDDRFAGGKGPGGTGRDKKWNLIVVDDPNKVNAMVAFANIVVFTGIIPICNDDQGLAAILGHEIGHEVARHGAENVSSSKVLLFFEFALQLFGMDFGISRLLTTLLLTLPNSRVKETEADTIGVRLAAKACYPGEAAVTMHERLGRHEEAHGGAGFEILRTHPTSEVRVKHLASLIPEANDIRAASPLCTHTSRVFRRFRDALGGFGFR